MADLVYAAFLGFVAGLVPVYIGLAPLWFFKRLSEAWRTLLVSFSSGILLFLLADVIHEAVGLSQGAGSSPVLFPVGLGLGLFGPFALTEVRRRKMPDPSPSSLPVATPRSDGTTKLFTAQMIALGIGLHNLGEGLAIGAAYAAGVFSLTNLLVVGFALHNSTEGLGISAPMASLRTRVREPVLLGFLAGSPTILGSVMGSLAYSSALGTLFFSAAAGALLYVIVELVRVTSASLRRGSVLVGTVLGILVTYGTGLLISGLA